MGGFAPLWSGSCVAELTRSPWVATLTARETREECNVSLELDCSEVEIPSIVLFQDEEELAPELEGRYLLSGQQLNNLNVLRVVGRAAESPEIEWFESIDRENFQWSGVGARIEHRLQCPEAFECMVSAVVQDRCGSRWADLLYRVGN